MHFSEIGHFDKGPLKSVKYKPDEELDFQKMQYAGKKYIQNQIWVKEISKT